MNGTNFPMYSGMKEKPIRVSELPKEKLELLKSIQQELIKLAQTIKALPKLSEEK